MSNAKFDFDLIDNVDDVKKSASDQIEKALTAIGLEAVARVNALVPVDTGRLRNSITFAVVNEDNEKAVYIGTNVEYAAKVEFDEKARHTTGQAHYLRDGISDNLGEYKRILNEVLSEG